jgi:hypothetical protein
MHLYLIAILLCFTGCIRSTSSITTGNDIGPGQSYLYGTWSATWKNQKLTFNLKKGKYSNIAEVKGLNTDGDPIKYTFKYKYGFREDIEFIEFMEVSRPSREHYYISTPTYVVFKIVTNLQENSATLFPLRLPEENELKTIKAFPNYVFNGKAYDLVKYIKMNLKKVMLSTIYTPITFTRHK